MGIAEGVVGVASGSDDGFVVTGREGLEAARGLEASLDESDLFPAVPDGPVATRLSDHLDLLEDRALVPLKADLRYLAVLIKGDEVSLEVQRLA